AKGSVLLPTTATSISIPGTNSSTSTFSQWRRASSTAGSSSSSERTFEIPTEEPSCAGLTNTGYPNGFCTGLLARSATCRVTGIAWSRTTYLKTSLSMQSAEASTPGPTYATSASSSIPCTVPSSPNGPWRIGSTTSTCASTAGALSEGSGTGSVSTTAPSPPSSSSVSFSSSAGGSTA